MGALTDAELMTVQRDPGATLGNPLLRTNGIRPPTTKIMALPVIIFDYPTSSDTTPNNDVTDPDSGNSATFYKQFVVITLLANRITEQKSVSMKTPPSPIRHL